MQRTPRARKLSAIGTIAAAAATFALCGWAVIESETENRRVVEQASATYDPPAIANYLTEDPDDTWTAGGTQ